MALGEDEVGGADLSSFEGAIRDLLGMVN